MATRTAEQVKIEYSDFAEWVPCDRAMPPANEIVSVLYADGCVVPASLPTNGKLFILEDGMYRYVDPVFWQPIKGSK